MQVSIQIMEFPSEIIEIIMEHSILDADDLLELFNYLSVSKRTREKWLNPESLIEFLDSFEMEYAPIVSLARGKEAHNDLYETAFDIMWKKMNYNVTRISDNDIGGLSRYGCVMTLKRYYKNNRGTMSLEHVVYAAICNCQLSVLEWIRQEEFGYLDIIARSSESVAIAFKMGHTKVLDFLSPDLRERFSRIGRCNIWNNILTQNEITCPNAARWFLRTIKHEDIDYDGSLIIRVVALCLRVLSLEELVKNGVVHNLQYEDVLFYVIKTDSDVNIEALEVQCDPSVIIYKCCREIEGSLIKNGKRPLMKRVIASALKRLCEIEYTDRDNLRIIETIYDSIQYFGVDLEDQLIDVLKSHNIRRNNNIVIISILSNCCRIAEFALQSYDSISKHERAVFIGASLHASRSFDVNAPLWDQLILPGFLDDSQTASLVARLSNRRIYDFKYH